MADLESLVLTIQAKTQIQDVNYVPAIRNTIESVWAIMAASADFVFLTPATPVSIELTPTKLDYIVKADNMGVPLEIQDSEGKRLYLYRDRRDFNSIRQGSGSAFAANAFFTRIGKAEGSLVIRVHPRPAETKTVYLTYNEAGSLANIDKLPSSGIKCLIHGVMAMLAPPKQIDISKGNTRWDAITYKEDQLFYTALALFIENESRMPEYLPEPQVPDYVTDVFVDARLDV